MVEELPTLEEISPTKGLDLDEKSALKHFLGKSREQARTLFMENAVYYQEYLRYMGARAFAFYFRELIPYLESDKSNFDSDVVNGILGTIDLRLDVDKQSIDLAQEAVLDVLSYCLRHYSKFDPDPDIYGDLKTELEKMIKRVVS